MRVSYSFLETPSLVEIFFENFRFRGELLAITLGGTTLCSEGEMIDKNFHLSLDRSPFYDQE